MSGPRGENVTYYVNCTVCGEWSHFFAMYRETLTFKHTCKWQGAFH